MPKSLVYEKAQLFALKIIELSKELKFRKQYIFSKQILRSGCSIGANISEALSAESSKDFVHKLNISLKETRETKYWLELLFLSNNLGKSKYDNLSHTCSELKKMLSSIILTVKEKQNK